MELLNELTAQEYKVLTLVAHGWRNAKIAQELFVSVRTIESHLHRIYDKLGVKSRTEAANFIFQLDPIFSNEIGEHTEQGTKYNRYA